MYDLTLEETIEHLEDYGLSFKGIDKVKLIYSDSLKSIDTTFSIRRIIAALIDESIHFEAFFDKTPKNMLLLGGKLANLGCGEREQEIFCDRLQQQVAN